MQPPAVSIFCKRCLKRLYLFYPNVRNKIRYVIRLHLLNRDAQLIVLMAQYCVLTRIIRRECCGKISVCYRFLRGLRRRFGRGRGILLRFIVC